MGKYSEILTTIEELWAETEGCAAIAEKVNAEYGTSYDAKEIEQIVSEWAQDWYFARHAIIPEEE